MSSEEDSEIERRVRGLSSHICRVIRAPAILRWMPGFVNQVDARDISTTNRCDQEKAALQMLDILTRCTSPGKWTAFIEALEHADYPYVAALLKDRNRCSEQFRHQKKILEIFAPYLEQQLEPHDVIYHLHGASLINSEDIEEIQACQRAKGSLTATMMMLDRMQRRQAPSMWYINFLRILCQKGHQEIVRDMEPEFTLDCEILKTSSNYLKVSSDSDSDADDGKRNAVVENMIEAKVLHFKSEIAGLVNLEKMASHLCQLIEFDQAHRLVVLANHSQKKAIDSLIDQIFKLKAPNKWRQFISCLRLSDYPHLADLLSRPYTSCLAHKERELLRLFTQAVGPQLEPEALVPFLERDCAISQRDKEHIFTTLQNSGRTAASLVLLECVQCRLPPQKWFHVLLGALHECGRDDIVNKIDPDFLQKKEKFRDDNESDRVRAEGRCTTPAELLDAAYVHIYNLDKSAKAKLNEIRNRFEIMEKKLQDQIEHKTELLMKSLNEAEEKIKSSIDNVHCGVSKDKDQATVAQEIQESINYILDKRFYLRPTKEFMNVVKVGDLFDHEQDLKKLANNSASMTKNSWRTKDIYLRTLSGSSYSSCSSQSSGYLYVDNHSTTSSPRTSSNDENANYKSTHKVTFAEKEEMILDTPDKHKSLQNKSEQRTRLSSSKARDDYFLHYSKQKTRIGRIRTVSESSAISTDGSVLSSDMLSSQTDADTTEISSVSDLTKVSHTPDQKPTVQRTDSYLYHRKIIVPGRNKCLLWSLCAMAADKIVIADQVNSCIFLYDDVVGEFKKYKFGRRRIPIKVCNIGDQRLLILFRRKNSTSVLSLFNIEFRTCNSGKRVISGISYVKEFLSGCIQELHSITGGENKATVCCSNKHVHEISKEGIEAGITKLKINCDEWWPQYSTLDGCKDIIFIYDIYSRCVYSFKQNTGCILWHTDLPQIDGMVLCNDMIYLSENSKNTIEVLDKETGNRLQSLTEHVQRPLAMSCSVRQDVIIVTQYHPKGKHMNRVIKYF